MKKLDKVLNAIATAPWMDFVGIAIVVLGCIASGYITETLFTVKPSWGVWGKWVPFGIISIINVVISLMSTRLTSRMNNLGNWFGIINVVLSCSIDYILGNSAAPITYSVTFVIYTFAINKWMHSEKHKASKPLTGVKGRFALVSITILSLLVSFGLNYIGFETINTLYLLTSVVFGLSLSANILNAMKLSLQWQYWLVYDFVQLSKASTQGNVANVFKYIYYIITAIAGLSFWYNRTPKSKVKLV